MVRAPFSATSFAAFGSSSSNTISYLSSIFFGTSSPSLRTFSKCFYLSSFEAFVRLSSSPAPPNRSFTLLSVAAAGSGASVVGGSAAAAVAAGGSAAAAVPAYAATISASAA